jgi:5-methylcytosine-specific restriction endonuclease McrA
MNLSATIAKMRACGMPAEAIVECVEAITPDTFGGCVQRAIEHGFPADEVWGLVHTLMDTGAIRRSKTTVFRSGSKARWGYEGPVTPRLKDEDWIPLRMAILQRDGFVCEYCGVEGEDNAKWCVDHVVPLSRGGSNEPDNLVACCFPCNASKSDKLVHEWRGRYK